MRIIPAIDIKDGKCTQLVGGDPSTAKYYGDPVDAAKMWTYRGVDMLHIVDLDAALGTGNNLEKVLEIKDAVDVVLEYGGGVRDYRRAEMLLNEYGIDRVIIGTLAVDDYKRFSEGRDMIISEVPKRLRGRMIVSLDSKKGFVVTHGWSQGTAISAAAMAKLFENLVWGFLYTDVDVEGQMKGVNIERTRDVIESTKKPVIASGGVSSTEDVKKLSEAGAWGAVIGKALYEGKIELNEVFKC